MPSLVSIIIVNWSGKDLLSACLNSLAKITYPNFEIIVVDNGSTDGSVEMLKNFPITNHQLPITLRLVTNEENLGFAEGNNIGVKQAGGKYILLLNNDTEVEPDFLEHLVDEMESNPSTAVVQPKIIFKDSQLLQAGGSFFTHSGFLFHFGYLQNPKDPKYNKVMNIFSANGACMLVRKKVIEEIGLFDSDFFAYFEESDFCWRTLLAGYKVVYSPDSTIFHNGGQSASRLNPGFAQYYSFRNRFCSFIKNLSFFEMLKILPVHLFVCIFCLISFMIMGRVDCTIAIIKAFWWNLINLKKTLIKRKRIQREIRKISDRELMRLYKKNRNLDNYFLFFYKR